MNLDKSRASFSRNMWDEVKDMIHSRMEAKTVIDHSRYLGLLVVLGRSKKEVFSFDGSFYIQSMNSIQSINDRVGLSRF